MKTNFMNNLKRIRIDNNLSQKELAKLLNTSIKTISHWETGYSEPSVSQIIELCKCLQVSFEELLL